MSIRLWLAGVAFIGIGMLSGVMAVGQNEPASRPAAMVAPVKPGPLAATQPASAHLLVEDPTLPSPARSAGGAPNAGWMQRHEGYVAQAKAGSIDVYLEGDSITDFWHSRFRANWDKNFAAWKPACFGISGDRTQNLLYRIENGELDGVNPKVIVLLIGTNNLAINAVYGDNTAEDTVRGIKAVIDALHQKAPAAKMVVTAIFPRNDAKGGPDVWSRIKEVNAQIAAFDDGKDVRVININDKLADKDGKLLPSVMGADHLHPAEKGYQIWADALQPILTQWLGAPATAPQK